MNAPPRLFLASRNTGGEVLNLQALAAMTGTPLANLQRLFGRYGPWLVEGVYP